MYTPIAAGPAGFTLAATTWARLPDVDAVEIARLGGELVSVVRDGSTIVLLIDHRTGTRAVARVEFWRPDVMPESAIDGLLVMVDSAGEGDAVGSLCELVARLKQCSTDAATCSSRLAPRDSEHR